MPNLTGTDASQEPTVESQIAQINAGLAQALANADTSWESWCQLGILARAAKTYLTGGTFQSCEIEFDLGVPYPDDQHRWGAQMMAAHKRGWVTRLDWTEGKRGTVKGAPVRTWRGTPLALQVYRERLRAFVGTGEAA